MQGRETAHSGPRWLLIGAEIVLSLGCWGVRLSLLPASSRAPGCWANLVPAFIFGRPEPTMNANTDTPWWRHWSIWVALALAALAIFLPVFR